MARSIGGLIRVCGRLFVADGRGRGIIARTVTGLMFGLFLLGSPAIQSTANAASVGFVTGDSFSNDSTDWPFLMTSATMYSTAISGQRLVQMETTFADQLAFHIANHAIDFAVVQGGVNDIANNSITLAMAQNAIGNMASVAAAANVPLFIVNIAPWTNASSQTKRDEIDMYNAWLDATLGGGSRTTVVDIYSLLVDPASAQRMNPLYDLDGVHPNAAGQRLIAAAVDGAVLSYVPIPAAAWLFGSGLILLFGLRRRALS